MSVWKSNFKRFLMAGGAGMGGGGTIYLSGPKTVVENTETGVEIGRLSVKEAGSGTFSLEVGYDAGGRLSIGTAGPGGDVPLQTTSTPFEYDEGVTSHVIRVKWVRSAPYKELVVEFTINVLNEVDGPVLTDVTFSSSGPFDFNVEAGTVLATLGNLQDAEVSLSDPNGYAVLNAEKTALLRSLNPWTEGQKSLQVIKTLADSPNSPYSTTWEYEVGSDIYDVIVTNDSELDAALETYGTAGGVIGLSPTGTFAARTISKAPSSELRLIGMGGKPSIPGGINLSNCSNLTLENLDLGDDVSTEGACVYSLGSPLPGLCSNIKIVGCDIYGPTFDHTAAADYSAGPPHNRQGVAGRFEGLQVIDCNVRHVWQGVKVDIQGSSPCRAVGNRIDKYYEDGVTFGWSTLSAPPMDVSWNCFSRNVALGTDIPEGASSGPHSDAIQLFPGGEGTESAPSIRIVGNIHMELDGRGGNQAHALLSRAVATGAREVVVKYNLWVHNSSADHDPYLNDLLSSYVFGNRAVRAVPGGGTGAISGVMNGFAGGTLSYVGYNIIENPPAPGSSGVAEGGLSLPNTEADYLAFFEGAVFNPQTPEEAWAAYRPRAGQGFDFLRSVDWVTRTYDETLEPGYAGLRPLSGQSLDSQVTSEWVPVLAGGLDQTYQIEHGEIRFASDSDGSDATAWTSVDGTLDEGDYLQRRLTTSIEGSSTTVATTTINGYVNSWYVQTASVLSYDTMDNQFSSGTPAYSTLGSLPSVAGQKKLVVATRFKLNSVDGTNQSLFSTGSGGAPFQIELVSTNLIRIQLGSSGTFRVVLDWTPDTDWHDLQFIVDFTQAAAEDTYAFYLDGVRTEVRSGPSITVGSSFNQTVFSTMGVFARTNAAQPANALIDMFWADFGTESYVLPDLSDPTVRDRFQADHINLADGSGVTGSVPKLFFPGDPAGWNDAGGFANRGSVSVMLTKQAGEYLDETAGVGEVTDVEFSIFQAEDKSLGLSSIEGFANIPEGNSVTVTVPADFPIQLSYED